MKLSLKQNRLRLSQHARKRCIERKLPIGLLMCLINKNKFEVIEVVDNHTRFICHVTAQYKRAEVQFRFVYDIYNGKIVTLYRI